MRSEAQRESLKALAAEVMRLGIRGDISAVDLTALAAVLQAALAEEARDAA